MKTHRRIEITAIRRRIFTARDNASDDETVSTADLRKSAHGWMIEIGADEGQTLVREVLRLIEESDERTCKTDQEEKV